MASKNHIHKYQYMRLGRGRDAKYVYACSLPDCSHHIPFGQDRLVIGKKSICWQCNQEMIMSKDIYRNKIRKPRCWKCRGVDKPILVETQEQAVEVAKTDEAIDLILKMSLGGLGGAK